MKTKTLLLTLLTLSLASATFAAGGGCLAIATSSPQQAGGAFASTFSATKVIDVDLTVLFTQGVANRYTGDHVLEVKIFTPKGNLYQSISVPFSYDKTKKGQKNSVAGYPQPVDVKVLTEMTYQNGKQYGVNVTLPVAGTPILNNSLYGTWTAQAFVDGDRLPCSQTSSFTITQ
jgi:hypothetical protein